MKYRSYEYNPPRPQAFPVPVVGLWKRFLAYLIDSTILSFISIGLFVLSVFVSARNVSFASLEDLEPLFTNLEGSTLIINGASLLIAIIYYVGCWAGGGQTLGKLLTGIKIVGDDGRAPSLAAAIIRYLGYYVSNLVFAVGFATIAFDKRKQGWHDKWANTFVVPADVEVPPGFEPVFLDEDPASQQDKYAVYLYYGFTFLLVCCLPAAIVTLLPQFMANGSTAP